MVLIRQNKGAKIIFHAKSPTFGAAKLNFFTVCEYVDEPYIINTTGLPDRKMAPYYGSMFSCFDMTQQRRETDRQTDRQTDKQKCCS